jgi:hypothetical protein
MARLTIQAPKTTPKIAVKGDATKVVDNSGNAAMCIMACIVSKT